jgi:hypothetical protein
MMQDFLTSNYNKDVSTNDFQLAVERHMVPGMDLERNGKMDWFFREWVYGTEIPSYKFKYSLEQSGDKTILNGQVTQSGVSENFRMLVPVYADFGKGWYRLGLAAMRGNSTVELKNLALPMAPKRVAVAPLQDILAEKMESTKQ